MNCPCREFELLNVQTVLKAYSYRSKSLVGGICAVFSTAAASWLGFILFVSHKEQVSGPWVFVVFLFIAFLISAAWFGYGLISPFEQKIDEKENYEYPRP